jgi:3-oxoacyl-[acyl-carrier protein] reductase
MVEAFVGDQGTALVTGAAGAIGHEVVRQLSTAGFAVAGHDLIEPQDQLGARWLNGDIQGAEGREAVHIAAEMLGSLDVVVHCAGGADPMPFLQIDDATWNEALELNCSVTFRVCQEAARLMHIAGGGRLIVISSLCARVAWRGFAHYCSAKAATDMICRSMAVELAPLGITVNAILPGTIATPLTARVGMSAADEERLVARTPAGRMGTPDEIARVVCWLASEAPSFLTGESLIVDGGYGIEGTP